jgi:hypothetical protein
MTTLSTKLVRSFGWLTVLTRDRDLTDPNDTEVFYVGLGDRFDDDRRLVREAPSERRPAISSRLGWRFPSAYLSR